MRAKLETKYMLECPRCTLSPSTCSGCGIPFEALEEVACVDHGVLHYHPKCRSKAHRRIDFKEDHDGAYVVLIQRPGEAPELELAFYDGNRSISDAETRLDLLRKAIEQARDWRSQGKKWKT